MTNPPSAGPPSVGPSPSEPRRYGSRPFGNASRPPHAGGDPGAWDEQQWRRPAEGDAAARAPLPPIEAPYGGPPRTTPPDATWRPPVVIQVPPARQLPPQDDTALDSREQQARTITYGVGMVTGAIALIVLFILCGRALF